jgi:hypothetical protein
MMLWPIPAPPKEKEPPVTPDFDPDAILHLDDILNPPGGSKQEGELSLLHFHVLVTDMII